MGEAVNTRIDNVQDIVETMLLEEIDPNPEKIQETKNLLDDFQDDMKDENPMYLQNMADFLEELIASEECDVLIKSILEKEKMLRVNMEIDTVQEIIKGKFMVIDITNELAKELAEHFYFVIDQIDDFQQDLSNNPDNYQYLKEFNNQLNNLLEREIDIQSYYFIQNSMAREYFKKLRDSNFNLQNLRGYKTEINLQQLINLSNDIEVYGASSSEVVQEVELIKLNVEIDNTQIDLIRKFNANYSEFPGLKQRAAVVVSAIDVFQEDLSNNPNNYQYLESFHAQLKSLLENKENVPQQIESEVLHGDEENIINAMKKEYIREIRNVSVSSDITEQLFDLSTMNMHIKYFIRLRNFIEQHKNEPNLATQIDQEIAVIKSNISIDKSQVVIRNGLVKTGEGFSDILENELTIMDYINTFQQDFSNPKDFQYLKDLNDLLTNILKRKVLWGDSGHVNTTMQKGYYFSTDNFLRDSTINESVSGEILTKLRTLFRIDAHPQYFKKLKSFIEQNKDKPELVKRFAQEVEIVKLNVSIDSHKRVLKSRFDSPGESTFILLEKIDIFQVDLSNTGSLASLQSFSKLLENLIRESNTSATVKSRIKQAMKDFYGVNT